MYKVISPSYRLSMCEYFYLKVIDYLSPSDTELLIRGIDKVLEMLTEYEADDAQHDELITKAF